MPIRLMDGAVDEEWLPTVLRSHKIVSTTVTRPDAPVPVSDFPELNNLARNVHALRKGNGWSQAQLADHAGLSYVAVSTVERAPEKTCLSTFLAICQALSEDAPTLFSAPTASGLVRQNHANSADTIPSRIRTLRQERGLSGRQLAAALGIHHVSLSRYENGCKDPTLGSLASIAVELDVSVSRFWQ